MVAKKTTTKKTTTKTSTKTGTKSSPVSLCGNIFRFIILALTLIALLLQFLTTASCDHVELDDNYNSGKTMGVYYESNYQGECFESSYKTDDPFIKSSRWMLAISILAGGVGGFLVFVEWVLFDFACAGILESLAYFIAWTASALTFIFYGAQVCQEDEYEQVGDFLDTNVVEGELDFTGTGCVYSKSSNFMTIATACYFLASFFLCCKW